jgi:hypothetical protein
LEVFTHKDPPFSKVEYLFLSPDDAMGDGTGLPNGPSTRPSLVIDKDGNAQAVFLKQAKAADVTMATPPQSLAVDNNGQAEAIFPPASKRRRLNKADYRALIPQEQGQDIRQASRRTVCFSDFPTVIDLPSDDGVSSTPEGFQHGQSSALKNKQPNRPEADITKPLCSILERSAKDIHLRIGQHAESYERTRREDPNDEQQDKRSMPSVPSTNPTQKPRSEPDVVVINDEDSDEETILPELGVSRIQETARSRAPEATDIDTSNDEQQPVKPKKRVSVQFSWLGTPLGPRGERLMLITNAADGVPQQPPPLVLSRQQHIPPGRRLRQPSQQATPPPRPLLAPTVSIKKADACTCLKYLVTIVTMNNEKFIRVDETHLLYATTASHLNSGPDVTIRRNAYRDWDSQREGGRPSILFELYPQGQYAYTPENSRRKNPPLEFRPNLDNSGRVLLTPSGRPLKFSNVIPGQISTEIEGWEMKAICRLDPDICH